MEMSKSSVIAFERFGVLTEKPHSNPDTPKEKE
jgi:hypothetical protein